MSEDDALLGLDADLASRIAAIPIPGQRWLKMALVSVGDFEPVGRGEQPQPAAVVRVAEREARERARVAEPEPPPRREPAPERDPADEPVRERPVVDLEDVVSGRARLDEQLESYPELADELEGLADVIDLLREAGQARRRKGEDVLRELGLTPPERADAEADAEAAEDEDEL